MKITLCGSTKFKKAFQEWNKRLTFEGHIVYSVAMFGHADGVSLTKDEKTHLDLIHLIKIQESEAIFVLDVKKDGEPYIGESTAREIMWAELLGKEVIKLSEVHPEWTEELVKE